MLPRVGFGAILGSFWGPFWSSFGYNLGAKIEEVFLYVFGSVWVSVWVPLGLQNDSIWEPGGALEAKKRHLQKSCFT